MVTKALLRGSISYSMVPSEKSMSFRIATPLMTFMADTERQLRNSTVSFWAIQLSAFRATAIRPGEEDLPGCLPSFCAIMCVESRIKKKKLNVLYMVCCFKFSNDNGAKLNNK